jgi:hypothetical protein
MRAAELIALLIFGPVLLLTIGTIGVFGFVVVEPFSQSFGSPPASLGWGDPGGSVVVFASAGFIGLIVVILLWMVYSPIRSDRRQAYRR